MSDLDVRIISRKIEADGITSFELVSLDGSHLPPFSAGSHIDVHVPGGLVRQYSLCNDPAETHRYRIAVLNDPISRGGSVAMHEKVTVGSHVRISPPRNHFQLASADDFLLFAGGIGITPLLCMAQFLHSTGKQFEMHCSARSPSVMAFRFELQNSPFSPKVHFHFDNGPDEQKLNIATALGKSGPHKHVYICGPSGYITFVVEAAKLAGYPLDNIHTEHFAANQVGQRGEHSFNVKISSTGKIFSIPSESTVVRELAKHGIEIPVSCEQGVCGMCITRVLEGECDHRDLYFTDAEKEKNDQFTPCCSRAVSGTLVLDI